MTIEIDGRALVLHRRHATTEAILRQLTRIGMAADCVWPELPAAVDAAAYRVLFFDADMGHDGQFPWAPGEAPMPAIALIGSEAPGRVAWAIGRGADAQLLKPIASGGVFSALLVARSGFARRRQLNAEIAALRQRLLLREAVAAATAQLMLAEGLGATDAYARLRRLAMDRQLPIETLAAQMVAARPEKKHGHA